MQQLEFLMSVVGRWWKVAVPIGLVAAGVVFASLTLFKPAIFQADAILRIRGHAPFLAFQTNQGRTDRFASTQLALVRTRAVLGPALLELKKKNPELEVKDEQCDWLNDRLKARITQTEMVELTFKAPQAELARDALQCILDSYLVYAQSIESTSEDRVIQLLNDEQQSRKAIVNAKRDEVREEVQASGLLPNEDGPTNKSSFSAMEQLLVRTEVDLEVLTARLTAEQERISNGEARTASERELYEMINATPEVAIIRQSIANTESRIESYLARLNNPEASPLVIRARKEMELLNEELEKAQSRIRQEAEDEFRRVKAAANAERLTNLEEQIASKEAIRNRLLDRLEEEKKRRSGDAIDLEFAKDELARQEDIYDRISSRIVALQTERRAPDRVEVVDPPRIPQKPLPMDLKKPLLLAIAALFAPIVLCFLFERIYERVANAEVLAESAGVSVFGETARIPANGNAFGEDIVLEDYLAYRESVSSVGSLIRLSNSQDNKAKVVSLVSSVANEGKTHLASHLAAYLGGSQQHRTLLVEADLRAPSFGRLLGLESCDGLSQVLNGEATLEDTIKKVFIPNFGQMDILVAGGDSGRCLPLNLDRLNEVFAAIREKYDYVVVDTSPILSTTEALPVAMLSDLNLLCAMKGHSRMAQIRNSIERLQHVKANVTGIVLNGVEPREYYSRYGRYYSHSDSA